MTQYFTDFSEYTAGAAPSDWSFPRNANSGWSVEGDPKRLRLVSPTSAQHIMWDDVSATDVEVFTKSAQVGGALANRPRAWLRFSSNNSGYMVSGLISGGGTLAVWRAPGTETFTQVASVSKSYALTTVYCYRIRINGSSIKIRCWPDGENEPATWDIDTTDSTYSGAGSVGFGYPAVNSRTMEYYTMGVGTDGDAAPTTAPSNSPTITSITASLITSSGARITLGLTR